MGFFVRAFMEDVTIWKSLIFNLISMGRLITLFLKSGMDKCILWMTLTTDTRDHKYPLMIEVSTGLLNPMIKLKENFSIERF